MGKKRIRTKYISKGGSNYSAVTKKLVRRARSEADVMINKFNAWLKGQNPWITIDNPNQNETNKRRIRVKSNDHWGNPRSRARHFSFGGAA